MLKEAALALSLSCGADFTTTKIGLERGFDDRSLCGRSLPCHAGMQTAYVGVGAIVVDKVSKKHGKKWGLLTLGVFMALPIGSSVHNWRTLREKK